MSEETPDNPRDLAYALRAAQRAAVAAQEEFSRAKALAQQAEQRYLGARLALERLRLVAQRLSADGRNG